MSAAPQAGPALTVTPGTNTATWELGLASTEPVDFAVSSGKLVAAREEGASWRASWRLEPPRRPRLDVAAVFSGERLLSWVAVRQAVPQLQRVRAPPGARVVVRIASRLFEGTSGSDGIAVIPVEVPPGVRTAEVTAAGKTLSHDLLPPPLATRVLLTAGDGAVWAFELEPHGSPWEPLLVQPGRALRVSRLSAAVAPVVRQPLRPVEGAENEPWRVRAGAFWCFGLKIPQGVAAQASVTSPWIAGFGAAVLSSGVVYRQRDGGEVLQEALALAGWAEAELVLRRSRIGASLAPGMGVLRSTVRDRSTERRESGPLATLALRLGVGLVEIEARVLWSTAQPRVEVSPWAGLLGAGIRWPM